MRRIDYDWLPAANRRWGKLPMKTILRNIFAVIFGVAVGGAVNMGLIIASPIVIPPPAGVDVTDMESLKASIHLFEAKHFVFPFLAHALGTLAGAVIAFLIAGSHRSVFAFVIGGIFLAGGISAAYMIPAPTWFVVLDLVVAYIPMAWLGSKIGSKVIREADSPKS